jgi:acetylglutamate kinase
VSGGWTVLKLGGELLEEPGRVRELAAAIARASAVVPLVVVHGGGREIDAALKRAGIGKRQVDGVRVTDEATLAVVVEVLAGAINTRLVAAINAAGGRAVGLTGADAGVGTVAPAPPHTGVDGTVTDLGYVGRPTASGRPRLLSDLGSDGYLPVVASIGMSVDGALFNVNADTMAADVAARLGAARLVIAGATPGVLDEHGRTIAQLDQPAAGALIASGTASAGMVAKLRACQDAVGNGAAEVLLIDGRRAQVIEAVLTDADSRRAGDFLTRMVASR